MELRCSSARSSDTTEGVGFILTAVQWPWKLKSAKTYLPYGPAPKMDVDQACDRYLIVATGCRPVLSAGKRVYSKGPYVETTSAVPLPWTLAVDPQFQELWAPFFFQSFCAHANVDVELQDRSVLLNISHRGGSSAQRSTMASLLKLVPLTDVSAPLSQQLRDVDFTYQDAK